ncbi:hypothetical protein PhCBS80983_g01045 [Powellomyces hirtus]|uniref:Suppressor of white apricot N-terminal domain-containing protein n=1 Tax=Powellomyces hirtus TaxID=109895 RepID=A0A507EC89_9FUNG|nr:hypothetical protein PhCBS80983_g01045 [Powellomyces hirtus]
MQAKDIPTHSNFTFTKIKKICVYQQFVVVENGVYTYDASYSLKWQGDGETRIDRFDGRQLLDFLPAETAHQPHKEVEELEEELNFERYRDLVESERMEKTEQAVLQRVDEEWNELLLKRKPESGKMEPEVMQPAKAAIGYNYGTPAANEGQEDDDEGEDKDSASPSLLRHADIFHVLDELDDDEVSSLNNMAKAYGIGNVYRRLYEVRRDEEEKELGEKEAAKLHHARRHKGIKRQRNNGRDAIGFRRSPGPKRRASPSYAPYGGGQSPVRETRPGRLNSPEGEDSVEYITEFGTDEVNTERSPSGWGPEESSAKQGSVDLSINGLNRRVVTGSSSASSSLTDSAPPKRLTPLERLKLKAQLALDKQSQTAAAA